MSDQTPHDRFCFKCGCVMEQRVPDMDDRPRWICTSCGFIFYQNPRVIVGTLGLWEDRILLCRRAINPRRGLWTLPAGFMENGETVEEGALRETEEEAGAEARITGLYSVCSLPHVNQVYMIFLADLLSPELNPNFETLEARLMKPEEIPWDELAFHSIIETLKRYCADPSNRALQRFSILPDDNRDW